MRTALGGERIWSRNFRLIIKRRASASLLASARAPIALRAPNHSFGIAHRATANAVMRAKSTSESEETRIE